MFDYFGNRDKVVMAESYLNNFGNKDSAKAILITGPPGSGKTHLVDHIAEKRGLEVAMLNASDDRTKASLSHVKNIAMSQEGMPIAIVLDEADAMKSQYIMDLIEKTKVPLFLTCNFVDDIDYSVRNKCQMVKIDPPQRWDFENYMKTLCAKYNINIDPNELQQRAKRAKSFRHAERLVDDPTDEDPDRYELQYQTIERMLRGDIIDHIDIKPDALNTRIFDVVGDGKLASDVNIILEHAYLNDYRFWSYAYGILECVRSNRKVEPITRTFKMMGEAKKKHKAEVSAGSKAFEKATEAIKVDISKMTTQVVETEGDFFAGMDISDLGMSNEQSNIIQDNKQETQTTIGEWL